ncbi:MAG: helix-turn-helix domain-containing protein [Tepidisphaeraceae bacterium]|jgi:HTH-type transcriptional regulator/antitoxin HigA
MTIAVTQPSPRYLKLVRKFPLRVIGSEAQYDAAIAIIQRLAVRGEEGLDVGEADYLYALTSLVETYENEHYPIGPDGLRPHERLKWLAEESGLSQAKLAKLLGVSQPLVSLILLGKRELTVAHIRRLSEHFHINPRYFMA